ncbi:helix-turn-helix transcriptional regulator [Streptomyces nojiriensis]
MRAVRRGKELSQKELGARVGVRGPTVARWESGEEFPKGRNSRGSPRHLVRTLTPSSPTTAPWTCSCFAATPASAWRRPPRPSTPVACH